MEYLVNRLKSDPTIEKVWFDEKEKEWSLNASPMHPIERNAEDVIEYWEELTDKEKSDLYGIKPPMDVQDENNLSEKYKLLEEENSLLTQENEELKADLEKANKVIESFGKKLKKEEKTQ